jgi:uncharacterized protein DUF3800
MPSFLIPVGGVDIFYADESAGSGVFAMASLRIPMIRAEKSGQAKMVWPDYYEKATSWRRSLSNTHMIRFRAELHGSELLSNKGKLHKSGRPLGREEAFKVFAGALETLSFLPDASLMVGATTKNSQLFGETKMTAALTALLQRIQRQTEHEKTCGMIFFDEGHAEYFHAYRKAQKYLPVGSAFGGWPGGGATMNKPLKLFIEDGNPKSSKTSYLMQIVDLVAYAALQKLKGEVGELSERRKTLGHHKLFDLIPERVRNLRVQPRRGDGIALV